MTGVTLLMQLFGALGLNVRPYIPKREGEGYGLNLAAVEKLHQARVAEEALDRAVHADVRVDAR